MEHHIARWLEDWRRESRPQSGWAPQASYRSLHYSEVKDCPLVYGRRTERLGMHFTLLVCGAHRVHLDKNIWRFIKWFSH